MCFDSFGIEHLFFSASFGFEPLFFSDSFGIEHFFFSDSFGIEPFFFSDSFGIELLFLSHSFGIEPLFFSESFAFMYNFCATLRSLTQDNPSILLQCRSCFLFLTCISALLKHLWVPLLDCRAHSAFATFLVRFVICFGFRTPTYS